VIENRAAIYMSNLLMTACEPGQRRRAALTTCLTMSEMGHPIEDIRDTLVCLGLLADPSASPRPGLHAR
jgi:hypothetical protein